MKPLQLISSVRSGLKPAGSFFFVALSFLLFMEGRLYAQAWNRAVFRGDEIEPRDFEFNKEYFLNLLSYKPAPDWETLWRGTERGYLVTVGSTRSDEFYIRQEVKLHVEVAEGARFHYDLLQDEDFDARFLRHRVALAFPVHENWTLYGLGEGTAAKEDNDVGAGVIFHPGPEQEWEAQLTAVDFNEKKGKDGRHFSKDPYGVLFRNRIAFSERFFIGGSAELQLPMTLVDPGENLEFHFDKRLFGGHLGWRVTDASLLRLFVSAEETGKNTEDATPLDEDQRLKRHSLMAGAEFQWWWDGLEADCRLGVQDFHFRERSELPDGPQNSEKHERDELTVYGGLSVEVWDRIFFRPALYVDYVSQNRLFPDEPFRNDRYNGIQSKLSGAVEIRFRKRLRLLINPNIDLDQMNWGGGNVQFIAVF